jgi:hypothetical protein
MFRTRAVRCVRSTSNAVAECAKCFYSSRGTQTRVVVTVVLSFTRREKWQPLRAYRAQPRQFRHYRIPPPPCPLSCNQNQTTRLPARTVSWREFTVPVTDHLPFRGNRRLLWRRKAALTHHASCIMIHVSYTSDIEFIPEGLKFCEVLKSLSLRTARLRWMRNK